MTIFWLMPNWSSDVVSGRGREGRAEAERWGSEGEEWEVGERRASGWSVIMPFTRAPWKHGSASSYLWVCVCVRNVGASCMSTKCLHACLSTRASSDSSREKQGLYRFERGVRLNGSGISIQRWRCSCICRCLEAGAVDAIASKLWMQRKLMPSEKGWICKRV